MPAGGRAVRAVLEPSGIDELVVLLTDGDVTKREAVLWGVTLSEAEPYLQRQLERRAVDVALLSLLGVKLPGQARTARPSRFKGLGEACGGTLIETCRPFFQDKLHVACRTCPGPRKG